MVFAKWLAATRIGQRIEAVLPNAVSWIKDHIGFGSIGRLFQVAFSEAARLAYLKSFRQSEPDVRKRIEYAERWIEIVATRSQTLLQFNSILIAVLALGGPSTASVRAEHWIALAWAASSLPLLYNIFVFLFSWVPPDGTPTPKTSSSPGPCETLQSAALFLTSV